MIVSKPVKDMLTMNCSWMLITLKRLDYNYIYELDLPEYTRGKNQGFQTPQALVDWINYTVYLKNVSYFLIHWAAY